MAQPDLKGTLAVFIGAKRDKPWPLRTTSVPTLMGDVQENLAIPISS